MGELLPLGDRLKVLPLRPSSTSKGGILLPESSEQRDRPLYGLVLAVGRGRQLESGEIVPLECDTGDVISFGKYAGVTVFDDDTGCDVMLMREDEALGRRAGEDYPMVTHNGSEHVVGDPRCEVCRAG